MIDLCLFDPEGAQVAGELLPIALTFCTFGKIQFRNQLLSALQRKRFAVIVIVFDDLLLVFRVFCHEMHPMRADDPQPISVF